MHMQPRTHGSIFRALKVTSEMATSGAESAVCDCLVTEASSNINHKILQVVLGGNHVVQAHGTGAREKSKKWK